MKRPAYHGARFSVLGSLVILLLLPLPLQAQELDLETVISGEEHGTLWTASFEAVPGATVVFEPESIIYDEYWETPPPKPSNAPVRQHESTFEYYIPNGRVTDVSYIDWDPPYYFIKIEWQVLRTEERFVSYDFSHLDWTEEQKKDYLSSRREGIRPGKNLLFDPVSGEFGFDSRAFYTRVGEAVNIYWGRGQGIVTKAPEVPPEGPIQVDTLSDIDDGNYSENNQSLREALRRAGERSGSITIPVKVTGTINLTRPLTLSGGNGNQIRLRVAQGSLVLDGREQTRIFTVPASKRLLPD